MLSDLFIVCFHHANLVLRVRRAEKKGMGPNAVSEAKYGMATDLKPAEMGEEWPERKGILAKVVFFRLLLFIVSSRRAACLPAGAAQPN